MKETDEFRQAIQSYLEQRAKTDELFMLSYCKPGKNINDCITYILNAVKETGCNGFADEEIYSFATHYYDEDHINVGKPVNCRVVINQHVELTEEEEKKARESAFKRYETEAYNALRKRQEKKNRQKDTENEKQYSLF